MNVDEADGFDPEHLEKWWKVSRAYLTGPFAELPPDDVAQVVVPQAAACVLVGLIHGMALRMNAGSGRPEMLLREAVSEFSGYLDGIRATA